jgi:hypothetical protein
MKKTLREVEQRIIPLLENPDNQWIVIEALRMQLALHGVYVGSAMRSVDPPKSEYQLRAAQETLVGKVWQRADARKRANRRYYLRQRIKELRESGTDAGLLAQLEEELHALLNASTKAAGEPQVTVGELEASGLGTDTPKAVAPDPAIMKRGLEVAQAYLASLDNQESNAE